ncbi:MAG: hypothetical protein ACRD96_23945, partial [Bryobacteraceae bacterium]
SGWRLRPVAAAKSFRVEKRVEGKWAPVASFLFQLDACKPPARKEPEPPPEAAPPVTEAAAPAKPAAPPSLKRTKK